MLSKQFLIQGGYTILSIRFCAFLFDFLTLDIEHIIADQVGMLCYI